MKSVQFRFFYILFVSLSVLGNAQVHSTISNEYLINSQKKKEVIMTLVSQDAAGRASGTQGALFVRNFIESEFISIGLNKWRGEYIQSFPINVPKTAKNNATTLTGYNVVGFLPTQTKDNSYIVIGAHYDHMGTLNGNIYPGADDNASGIALLLELASIFGEIWRNGNLNKNIVFVAFDGNNHNNAGSKFFASDFGHPFHKIQCMINLDQIGSSLSAPGDNKEYILVLGLENLDKWSKEQLYFFNSNTSSPLNLDIDSTYYGSESFYKIFYGLSDQSSFTDKKIPSLLFTSGITHVTNREGDDISVIDFPLLNKRSKLIYRFIFSLMQR